ncbi:Hypothetical predicted protein [Paramuricea clavata]|uniref:Uncharacterized protein n=1 Tax=Paramuricea clavata TaxID=317549 RepID=A0A6S7JG00_PARCT|nr:Hypothetical predicted protein [Paramuricea clavata]
MLAIAGDWLMHVAVCRSGGLKDVNRSCRQLTDDRQPLLLHMLIAQEQLHKYALRIEMSFPEDPTGDGCGFNGLSVVSAGSWLDRDGMLFVNDQSFPLPRI